MKTKYRYYIGGNRPINSMIVYYLMIFIMIFVIPFVFVIMNRLTVYSIVLSLLIGTVFSVFIVTFIFSSFIFGYFWAVDQNYLYSFQSALSFFQKMKYIIMYLLFLEPKLPIERFLLRDIVSIEISGFSQGAVVIPHFLLHFKNETVYKITGTSNKTEPIMQALKYLEKKNIKVYDRNQVLLKMRYYRNADHFWSMDKQIKK